MSNLTRRSVLRASLGAAAVALLARPYIANAQAKTATVWWAQGFVPEEDVAFKKMVADYEKVSGNKIDSASCRSRRCARRSSRRSPRASCRT